MAKLTAPLRWLWDKMRTLRRIAKVAAIVLVCLVVVYAVARGFLFAWYNAKVKGELARLEAAGGSQDIRRFIPQARGVGIAPDMINAAGMLYREPGHVEVIPVRRTTGDEWERAAAAEKAWNQYKQWPGFDLHRVRPVEPAEWDASWLALLEEHLTRNATGLSLAREGARIGEGAFLVIWDLEYEADVQHLARVRKCARLLSADAIMHAAKGDVDAAAEDVRLILRLERLIENEPSLISKLVTYACDGAGCWTLQGMLEFGAPSRESLKRILDELEGREKSYDLTNAFLMETAVGLNTFDRVRMDPEYLFYLGTSRSRSYGAFLRERGRFSRYLARLAFKLFWIEPSDRYHYLDTMNTYIEASKKGFPDALDAPPPVVRFRDWRDAPFELMTSLLTPALARVIPQDANATTYVRLARTIIALTMYKMDHGDYPDSLSALVPDYLPQIDADPYDGKPIRYKKRDSGCVVYSVGANRTDDGGVYADQWGKNGDITWER